MTNYNPLPGSSVTCEPLTVDKAQPDDPDAYPRRQPPVVTFVTINERAVHAHCPASPVEERLRSRTWTTIGRLPVYNPVVTFTANGNPVANMVRLRARPLIGTFRGCRLRSRPGSAIRSSARFADSDNYIAARAPAMLPSRSPSARFGKTMGFWGNKNGQARDSRRLLRDTLGTVTRRRTCSIVSQHQGQSDDDLRRTRLNGVSILTDCTTIASRDSGINANSLERRCSADVGVEAEHRSHRWLQWSANRCVGSHAPDGVPGWLVADGDKHRSAGSRLRELSDRAGQGGNGAPITQTMIPQLNTTLGQINAEA